jgi:DNA-3-methyladenine glycosylase II
VKPPTGVGRTSPAAIVEARRWLAERDPALARAHAAAPDFPWRIRPAGFAGLLKMIVEQQVSVASAAAIWRRLEDGLDEVTPATVLARTIDTLRSFGLSAPKARYAVGLAEAVHRGWVDFDRLDDLEVTEAVAALMAL